MIIFFKTQLANAMDKLRLVILRLEDAFVRQKVLLEKTVGVVTRRVTMQEILLMDPVFVRKK